MKRFEEIRTIDAVNLEKFLDAEIRIDMIDVENLTDKIQQVLRESGLSPASKEDIDNFIEKVIKNHNGTISTVAAFMGIEHKIKYNLKKE